MIVKILALSDIIATSVIILYLAEFFPLATIKYIAFYLIIKGGFFLLLSKDFASLVDALFGVYFLILSSGIYSNTIITTIAALWLFQKAILGLI